MAAEASKSTAGANTVDGGATATPYVGSVISLISKSEIRYQGILSTLDATKCTIGLRNVRIFGTEDRRKDGLQIPAIDEEYEYILFRGSDLKDLQVLASPPLQQTAPHLYNNPVQAHSIPSTAPSSLSTIPATATQTAGSQIPQFGIPQTTYQNITPLYHTQRASASWNTSPSPAVNSSVVSGYSGPSASVQPVLGLPTASSLLPPLAQQHVLYPNINPSFPTAASNISALAVDSSSVMRSQSTNSSLMPVPTVSQRSQMLQKDGEVVLTSHTPELKGSVAYAPVSTSAETQAMNSRFNKDEVWGELSRNRGKQHDSQYPQHDDNVDVRAPDKKPIYKKDDFFDNMSSNALDRESQIGRTRLSERMRVDTETFGNSSRGHGFRGGHGGRSQGGYRGRGYGYGGSDFAENKHCGL